MMVPVMYLIDTNVISETRKKHRANTGVQQFFNDAEKMQWTLYISVITLGELQRGLEVIRHRGDDLQAQHLASWLRVVVDEYAPFLLDFGATEAQVWGALRVPHYESAIDKQIAATALVCDLTLVTRNTKDFAGTGVRLLNPFS